MVVGAFPAAKLGVLALKQISKPIANIIKNRAKKSPFFSKYVCMPPAQFYNWIEVKTKMMALNLGKPTMVPKLTEAMAIELGANLLGEVIIFTIGAGVLILEYQRQSKKESLKEQLALQEKLELQCELNELAFKIEKQDTQIRELTRVIAEIESKSWTPKIINEMIGKKKVQTENKDNPLELLPESRRKQPLKPKVADEVKNSSSDAGISTRHSLLNQSLRFLIHDLNILNYSKSDTSEHVNSSSNSLEKAINFLFIEEEED